MKVFYLRGYYCPNIFKYNGLPRKIPIITAVFCTLMCLYAGQQVSAQEAEPAATAITPLQIGDSIPDDLWNMPLQVVNHPEGKETITLADYKGKLIILDFWATWCGSCIAAMPRLDDIEKNHGDSTLAIIPVTYEEKDHVIAFINSNPILNRLNKKSVVQDSTLKRAFSHRLLPHYAWIGHRGNVIHATNGNSITFENINKVLNSEDIDLEVKSDHLDWDEKMPILLDKPHAPSFFRSVLLGIDKGYPSRQNIIYNKEEDKLRVYALNRPIRSLYEIAYRLPAVYHPSRMVADKTNAHDFDQVLYCYEAEIAGNDTAKLFSHMQKNLDLQFNIRSSMVGEERWCWILKNQDNKKQPKVSKAQPFHNLDEKSREKTILKGQYIYLLASILSKSYQDLPLLNETEIRHTIDIELPVDLGNTEELNIKLSAYGLALTKERRKVETLYLTGHKRVQKGQQP